MKLAAVIDSLESVDENARGFYVADGDKFVLDTDVEAHPALTNLKSAFGHQKEKNAELKQKLKAFEGVDLDELAELRELTQQHKKKSKDEPDVEKLIEKRLAEKMAEVQPALDEADTLRRENRTLKLHGTVSKAALEAGVLPEALDDCLTASDRHFDLKDGKVIVLDEDGDPTGMTPLKFFTEQFKKSKPWFYAATQGGGSGQSTRKGTTGTTATGMSLDEIMKLPAAERMAMGRQGAAK